MATVVGLGLRTPPAAKKIDVFCPSRFLNVKVCERGIITKPSKLKKIMSFDRGTL